MCIFPRHLLQRASAHFILSTRLSSAVYFQYSEGLCSPKCCHQRHLQVPSRPFHIISMRTIHKVHLNFPSIITTELLAHMCRDKVIQACRCACGAVQGELQRVPWWPTQKLSVGLRVQHLLTLLSKRQCQSGLVCARARSATHAILRLYWLSYAACVAVLLWKQ